MKQFVFSIIALLCMVPAVAQEREDWDNLEVIGRNKTAPHVRRMDVDERWRMGLDGEWDFFFVEHPAEAPNGALLSLLEAPEEALPVACRRGKILVPGNMELQGYGAPVYVNVANEFRSNPPHAPREYNPVGCYVRDFEIDSLWKSRRTFLKIGAAKSCCRVYCNGQEVGYSQDSKTPAEFELSRFLRQGRNRLCVVVHRFSDGSYLECQDMWRVSGITRSVELYSLPAVYIRDYRVRTLLDTATYRQGTLDLVIDYSAEMPSEMQMEVELTDGALRMAWRKTVERDDWYSFLTEKVGEVEPWSPDHPHLYTLTLRLLDAEGKALHTTASRIGFRQVALLQREGVQQLCLNGEPLLIRGVNRHEHSGLTGQYVSPAEMREDIRLMKECHINAVRTSHYPCDELWYDLCDSAGLLVWDEANVEAHAQGYGAASLAKNSDWEEAILDRVNNMYHRDKNHPCVFVWSLGNETGNGVCMESAYRFLKGKDASRPVAYERAELDWNTDIVGLMYPSVDYLSAYARNPRNTRPYIMVEYCHAMGNSLGGLADYWDTIMKYPILQGGFIWDWVDQSLLRTDERGRTWYAVGGDLGTIPDCGNDDAFCANGLIGGNRKPHPHYFHAQQVYAGHYRCPTVDTLITAQPNTLRASLKQRKGMVWLATEKYSFRFNTATAEIESYCRHGKEMLRQPLRLNLWRPPTLNDLADNNGARAWQGIDGLRVELVECKVKGREARMVYRLVAPEGQAMMLRYILEAYEEGISLSFRLEPQGAFKTLPKMGVQMGIDTAFAQAAWRGLKAECYPDRRQGEVGLWRAATASLVGEQHVVPQESGNREASHLWLSTPEGDTLMLQAPSANFTLRRYADSTLTRCTRLWQLPEPLPYYVLCFDHRQAGLGSATCGPGVRAPYRLSGDSVYLYSFGLGTTPSLHAEALRPLPAVKKASPIASIEASAKPSGQYGATFPQCLYDVRQAVAGDYANGWAGWCGEDSLILDIALRQPVGIESITVGFCNAPNDWVLLPRSVEVMVDGGDWEPLSFTAFTTDRNALLSNPNASGERSRVRFHLASRHKKATHLRLRLRPQPTLPQGHPYCGEKAWLMMDEIEISTANK